MIADTRSNPLKSVLLALLKGSPKPGATAWGFEGIRPLGVVKVSGVVVEFVAGLSLLTVFGVSLDDDEEVEFPWAYTLATKISSKDAGRMRF